MKNNYKKRFNSINFLLVVFALVFMGVYYALDSFSIKVGGMASLKGVKWTTYFLEDSIELVEGSVPIDVSEDKNGIDVEEGFSSLHFNVLLKKPGDFCEFTIVLRNGGNEPTELYDVISSEITAEQDKYLNYYVAYSNGDEILKGDGLKGYQEVKVRFRVEYELDLQPDEIEEAREFDFSYKLNFIQENGGITRYVDDTPHPSPSSSPSE